MKRRFVAISASILCGRLGLLTEGVRQSFQVSNGLPVDAQVVDADIEPYTGSVRVWFEHPSFTDEDAEELVVVLQRMPGRVA